MYSRDWDILVELGRLRGEMARSRPGASEGEDASVWAPAVDICETDSHLLLSFDLPGVRKDDIDLRVDGSSLTLEGHRPGPEGVRRVRRERPSGRFRRSFRIDVPVDPSGARASYRDGVLEITMPKVPHPGPARVRIDIG